MQATGRPEGPEPVEERTYVVDLRDRGRPRYTGAYILTGPEPTVVETGGSISAPYLLAGLEALGVEPAQVRHVFVTHIHLDHAGGAGNLLRLMPEAKLYVHPRGARHLIDPSRLVAGAQVAWNGRAEELFGPVVPAPAERVVALRDGEVVALGGGRRLTAVDTPGHAPHHHAYYD
ncbi:MAG: MBL fold metallo-hydrolase, partial [Clostridia bacterium]|nr:MBL fold metallo-hydrolase [Clostridia bacterium]